MFIKFVIFVFYQRTFIMRHKAFKFFTWIVNDFSILLNVTQIIEFILQYIFFSLFWNRIYFIFEKTSSDSLSEYCISQTIHFTISLILNFVIEIIILIFSIINFWQFQLLKRKKIDLFFAFSFDMFVIVIFIVNFVINISLKNNDNYLWNDFDFFAWQIIQICFEMTCACVFAMTFLYQLFKQNIFNKSKMFNKYYRRISIIERSFFALNDKFFKTSINNDNMKNLNVHTISSNNEQNLKFKTL